MKQPLAYRMRPTNLDEIAGQQHLVGEGKIIRRMVEAGQLSSMILYGPPGIGKTSIASAISGSAGLPMKTLNAATGTKKELQVIAEESRFMGTTVLLLDEIHRLDKPKQDYLLPLLEKGQLILIGATTENPFISINPAIRSRSQIFELKPLAPEDILTILKRALTDKKKGLGKLNIKVSDDDLLHLASYTGGDVRSALTSLEVAVLSTPEVDGEVHLTSEIIEECTQKKTFSHDKNGDSHYDLMSAFQKSLRGSDVDASLHYLARLLEGGDILSVCRRLMITAYEDVGLAAPDVASRVVSATQVAERVGMPEARIPLANAVIEVALAPKSNSAYLAINEAIGDLYKGNVGDIPAHLRDGHYKGASELGRAVDYLYPHDYSGWVDQEYLPENLQGRQYFEGKGMSKYEKVIQDRYDTINKLKHEDD